MNFGLLSQIIIVNSLFLLFLMLNFQGRRNTYYASIAKAFASDVANKNAADAVQVSFLQIGNNPVLYMLSIACIAILNLC